MTYNPRRKTRTSRLDWSKLDELRTAVETAEDLGKPWTIFFDHFGENQEFLRLGRPVVDPRVHELFERALQSAGQHHLQRASVTVVDMCLIALPEHRLIHGPAQVNDHAATVIYFDDIQIGLVALTQLGSAQAHFTRFTLTMLRGDGGGLMRHRG
ncbi:MAG: hypothetical protein U1E76_12890 [Planctomycetota bacterium]